jgi:hypothetical protein
MVSCLISINWTSLTRPGRSGIISPINVAIVQTLLCAKLTVVFNRNRAIH